MNMKDDKSPREKQWEDRVDIAENKAKLEQHKAEEKVEDMNDDISIDEATQKAKHRWDEKFGD